MASERLKQRVERFLEQADEALDKLDWEQARVRAEAALDLDPESADAQALLAAVVRAEQRAGLTSRTESPSSLQESPLPATAAAQPKSFVNGRYAVKRFLGEGGKKKVYLAHDTLLDRDIAFALIKTEGLDEVGKERITREAQAMGRLGDHPNIVTVYDIGTEAGQPYLVLPL